MRLKNKKVLILADHTFEDLELLYPKYRLLEEGAEVFVAGKQDGETYKGKYGYPCNSDLSFDNVKPDEYDGLIIPGGYTPDKIRAIPKVKEITRHFSEEKKLIAFICHGGWVPISAKVLENVKCTSCKAIEDDMVNAGANWVDEAVVIDGHFISSRTPKDLPQFCPAIIEFLAKS